MLEAEHEQLRVVIRRCLRANVTLKPLEQQWRRLVLEEALAESNGNVCDVARKIGRHRNTVTRMVQELKIDIKKFSPPGTKNRWMVLNQFARKRKVEQKNIDTQDAKQRH